MYLVEAPNDKGFPEFTIYGADAARLRITLIESCLGQMSTSEPYEDFGRLQDALEAIESHPVAPTINRIAAWLIGQLDENLTARKEALDTAANQGIIDREQWFRLREQTQQAYRPDDVTFLNRHLFSSESRTVDRNNFAIHETPIADGDLDYEVEEQTIQAVFGEDSEHAVRRVWVYDFEQGERSGLREKAAMLGLTDPVSKTFVPEVAIRTQPFTAGEFSHGLTVPADPVLRRYGNRIVAS